MLQTLVVVGLFYLSHLTLYQPDIEVYCQGMMAMSDLEVGN
jgi:hypothetical protein